ncbi:hypothetical protein WJX72_004013 [[Myrmecia] bisecta]|uniref:Cilia- and flagella-associated protein 52 n=1 Tax=[Myrmecia] bisecta TaxID=41462 RepID=A0AAW1PKN7_9CHLO
MAGAMHLNAVVGFSGCVENGLVLHPDGKTLIYPLGSTVVLRNVNDKGTQDFLQGHTDKVSCLAISRSGRYLASGQQTYMGFKADVIIWDLEKHTLLHRMSLHKVKVQALDFSHDEKYLASLGGQDDNSLVLWDVETGEAVCGSPTANNFTFAVKFFNNSSNKLATGGNYNLNVWEYDLQQNKLRPHDVQLGSLQRCFHTIAVDENDHFMYCGTSTGDLLQINLDRKLLRNTGPAKGCLPQGITATCLAPSGDLVVGAGDGSLVIMKRDQDGDDARFLKKLPVITSIRLTGGITTVTVDERSMGPNKFSMLVGTRNCDIYRVTYDSQAKKLSEELIQTAHAQPIRSLAFPFQYSAVFATSSFGEIRIWHLDTCRELLRIAVPNLDCNCVAFMQDGKSIISGWSDGKIRAFGPQSGKLLYTIHDAHHRAVTAIASTADSSRIISGGEEGMVRVWRITKQSQSMIASMKEHKAAVNSIKLKESSNEECVSASSDGSCIIWDLATFHRRSSLFANTIFKSVAYHPDESQLVTAGTDRKITYWDAFDGQAIRILEGSDTEQLDCLAIDPDGEAIVSGSSDKLVKLWAYDAGHCYETGVAHSGHVTNVAVTDDRAKVVSTGSEGAIMIWSYHRPTPAGDLSAR